ncbi:hypothetical protein ACLB2K_025381 [Fragaria x ananassa]
MDVVKDGTTISGILPSSQVYPSSMSRVIDTMLDRGSLMGIDHEDVMILLSQIFAPKDVPDKLVLRMVKLLCSLIHVSFYG